MSKSALPRLGALASLDEAISGLEVAATNAGNLNVHTDSQAFINAFFAWHNQAAEHLRGRLDTTTVDRLLYSPQFWALRQLELYAPDLRNSVGLERDASVARLTAAREALEEARNRWRGEEAVFLVPDTNLLLHHPRTLSKVDWRALSDGAECTIRIVLPLVVVDELDRAKRSGKTHQRSRSRYTIKELHELGCYNGARAPVPSDPTVTIEIWVPGPTATTLEGDADLVERCNELRVLTGGRVVLVTYDGGAAGRAHAAGVRFLLLVDEPSPEG